MNNYKKSISFLSLIFVVSLSAMDSSPAKDKPNLLVLYKELLALNPSINQKREFPKPDFADKFEKCRHELFIVINNVDNDGQTGSSDVYKKLVSSSSEGRLLINDYFAHSRGLSLLARMQNFYGDGQAFHYQDTAGPNYFGLDPIIRCYSDSDGVQLTMYEVLNGLLNALSEVDKNSLYYEQNYEDFANALDRAIKKSKFYRDRRAIKQNLGTIGDNFMIPGIVDEVSEINDRLKSILQKYGLD